MIRVVVQFHVIKVNLDNFLKRHLNDRGTFRLPILICWLGWL